MCRTLSRGFVSAVSVGAVEGMVVGSVFMALGLEGVDGVLVAVDLGASSSSGSLCGCSGSASSFGLASGS